MTELLIASVLAAVLLLIWLVLERRGPSSGDDPYHVWAVARANTSDGITSRLEVEVLVQVTDPQVDRSSADADLVDALEGHLRQRITTHPVASLPSVGDETPFLAEDVVPGCRVLRGVVTLSDVEVTPELRRLVTDRADP